MTRHSVLCWSVAGLAALLAVMLPAVARADYSEEFELALARGEHLFQSGKVQEAAKYFDLCLQINPSSGRANQYRGDCALEEKDTSDAVAYLRKARDLEPANPEVLFDLARALTAADSYEAAWAVVDALPADVRKKPLVRYYEGVIQVGRKRYAAAMEPLSEVAALDEPEAYRASFYLGIVYERMHDPAGARAQYNRVLAKSDDAALTEATLQRVQRMERRAKAGQDWWSATLGAGLYYDDNIPLEPDKYAVSEQKGLVGRFYGDVFFRPLRTEKGYLGLGAGLRYHPLLAGDQDMRDYDLLRAAAILGTRWELFRTRVAGYLGARLLYDYTALSPDVRTYSHRGTGEVTFDLYEEKWCATRVRYRGIYGAYTNDKQRFPDNDRRDGFDHEPGIDQFFFLADQDGYVQVSASGLVNDADGRYYRYRGASGLAAVDLRLVWKLYLDAAVGYEWRDYIDHPKNRTDGELDAGGGLYITPLKWLRVAADYRFTWNQSSRDLYTYKRNVIGLSVEVRH
jgi:Flp pilus assembly protein TadD